jgi:putative ABC transport system substrate-binding protein
MRRRDFITLLGGAAAWPIAARAQQRSTPMVGVLDQSPAGSAPYVAAFRQGLRDSGFVEGQNLLIEYRWGENQNDRWPALVADLLSRNAAVIATPGGAQAALAAKQATSTTPIVFQMGDPVQLRLVASLNRPGGNITGITNLTTGLGAKRLELLHKLIPQAQTIAVLTTAAPNAGATTPELQEAARVLGLRVMFLRIAGENDLEAAFAGLSRQHADALMLTDGIVFNMNRAQIVALAARHAVPTMFTFREFTAAGGLISYASSLPDAYRLTGVYVARILKGDKPADLPVLQPTKFELVINLKTAKALGIDVPPTLLALADEVIE